MITAVIAGHWILLKFIVDFDFDYIKRLEWVELFFGFGEVMKIVNYCLLLKLLLIERVIGSVVEQVRVCIWSGRVNKKWETMVSIVIATDWDLNYEWNQVNSVCREQCDIEREWVDLPQSERKCERTTKNEAMWVEIGLTWDWRGKIMEIRKSI